MMAAICYETIGNIISNLFTDNLARMHAHMQNVRLRTFVPIPEND